MLVRSYLADESARNGKSLLAGIVFVVVPVSYLLSVPLFKYGGYLVVWLTALALLAGDIIFIVFFRPEGHHDNRISVSAQLPGTSDEMTGKTAFEEDQDAKKDQMVTTKNIVEAFVVTFRSRAGNQRISICFLMAALCCTLFTGGKHPIFIDPMYDKYCLF